MRVSKEELVAVLAQFNPWWRGEAIADLPIWRRAAFRELQAWMTQPPAPRAVLLSGARQIGKTTLLLQAADTLLRGGVPGANVLYATFDHPILKLAGIDAVIDAWREREPRADGPEYLLLDEAQFIRDWGTWVKHQVDFRKDRRIAFTGSAMPLVEADQESGVGRWHTIRLTTLSFYEYLQIKRLSLPDLPRCAACATCLTGRPRTSTASPKRAAPYVGHFHEYLVRGGFPQTAQVDSITQAQRLLREDIIDKVLKRDMTALFGVRRVLDLEHTFLYLCMHDGGLLDMVDLCANLEVKRPTAQNFIELLEATHLIYRLPHSATARTCCARVSRSTWPMPPSRRRSCSRARPSSKTHRRWAWPPRPPCSSTCLPATTHRTCASATGAASVITRSTWWPRSAANSFPSR
jgi:predicted AAA+ superfamily ATPase